MRVVFPYFAQLHQVFHSLPIAAEMSRRHPDIAVHAAGVSAEHVAFIRRQLARFASDAKVQVDALDEVILRRLPSKKRTMLKNRHYFRSFDAIVTPERTSLFMKKMGLVDTRFIWTRHGAGDRSIGFADDVHQFDYVLMAGRKIEQRLLESRQIRPGDYTVGVYAKFDWLRGRRDRPKLFDNDRATVLYNPHFDRELSSWSRFGGRVLDFFAANKKYNLIFAPHVRLFDPPTAFKYLPFREYEGVSHVRIDLGSERCIDMTYLEAADIYLGDVSSQVSEFACRPRPCVFLDAHGVDWRRDPNYRFWSLGPVLNDVADLGYRLDDAVMRHPAYVEAQRAYVAETFDVPEHGTSAARGADAIIEYLRRGDRAAA
ncbi:MAG TPA: hypothetical protein VJM11_11625 [Nevskiaceae bacterium]|nr:hypothetical protein [Nevskiaceae bacterium]